MNRSSKFSKWPVFALSLLLAGNGAATLTAGEDGWFSPAGPTVSMDEIAAAHTLQYTSEEASRPESSAIRPVSHQQRLQGPSAQNRGRRPVRMAMDGSGELSWSLDEESPFMFAEVEGKLTGEEEAPAAEVLPDEAIRVRPAEAGTESEPAEPAEPAGAVPVSNTPDAETAEEPALPAAEPEEDPAFAGQLPSFDPIPAEKMPASAAAGRDPVSATSDFETVKLPQAGTQIDRFGNIGFLANNYATRTEDGGLQPNPYADGVYDFHPRYFPWDPARQTHTREFPPCESYGTNGHGEPMVYEEDGVMYYNGCYGYGCCGFFGCLWSLLRNADLSAGVYAYQDPFKVSRDSSFGFDLGFNWTLPRRVLGMMWQAGARYTRSGKQETNIDDVILFDADEEYHRTQFFWTSGLFYRRPGGCWNFGAVYDSLRDETLLKYGVGQIRAELSRAVSCKTDIGFRGAFRLSDEKMTFASGDRRYTAKISAQSYYTAFIRHTFVTGAEGMLSGGVTEDEEALIAARLEVPVTNHSCIRNSFAYVFPKDKNKRERDDSWSASISWVVYLGGSSHGGLANPFKPLFDVADNTTLLQRAK